MKYEVDLRDDEPREVIGVRGVQSKQFRRRFKNAAASDAWIDKNEEDIEIYVIQRA